MGLVNRIYTKEEVICPHCKKPANYPNNKFSFQSNDLDGMYNWQLGEKIQLLLGGLTFTAKGNNKWLGFAVCWNCKKALECDIIIKNGKIHSIKNIRRFKYE